MQVFDDEGRLKVNFGATAADINIVDGGGHFAATEVESALQELGHLTVLTVAEVDQLENIGATTISAIQWGAVGALVEWTAWVPNIVGGADLSGYTSARYYRIGDLCFFNFTAETKDVTTAGAVEVTLPFSAANTGHNAVSYMINDGTNFVNASAIIAANSNILYIYKTLAIGNWAGTENGVTFRIDGFFEIA